MKNHLFLLLSLVLFLSCAPIIHYDQFENGKLYYENMRFYRIITQRDFISWSKNYHKFKTMDKNQPMLEFEEIVGYRFHNWRERPRQYLQASLFRIDRNEDNTDLIEFEMLDYALDKGVIYKDQISFRYCVYPSLNRSGYTHLNKVYAKIVGREKAKLVWIVYSEDISYKKDFRYYYDDWENIDSLSPKQKLRLEQFLKDADRSFRIVPN